MKKTYAQQIDNIFTYANNELKVLSSQYEVYYADIQTLSKDNLDFFPNPLDIHPNAKGYNAISKQIIKLINKYVLD
jgi:lysophospholipase L1-like esterase